MVLALMRWGLRPCMEMEPNVNVTNAKLWKCRFWVDTRHQAGAINASWGFCSPSLGLGSTNGLVISLGMWMVVLSALLYEGGNILGDEGKLRLVS